MTAICIGNAPFKNQQMEKIGCRTDDCKIYELEKILKKLLVKFM